MKTHNRPTLLSSLIDADDSILIIIDVQDYFVNKLPIETRDSLIKRIVWLIQVALQLNIPIIVTAEDIPNCGTICSQLTEVLPSDVVIHNKMVFGLAEEPQIMSAVRNTGRRTAILVGLETDVCVAHSAIGLLQHDYQVTVIENATASPEMGHQFGLQRMRDAGVLISNIKSLYYEWVRTVAQDDKVKAKMTEGFGFPCGIGL